MKKLSFLGLLFFVFLNSINSNNISSIINNNFIPFDLINCQDQHTYLGFVAFDHGNIICGYGGGIQTCLLNEYKNCKDYVEIYFSKTVFTNINSQNFKYRKWLFPIKYKIIIKESDIIGAFENNKPGIVYVDISKTYPTTCQAIVIDNLNIRDAPSLKGNIIGKIIKRTEITLYDKSIHQDEIDGENDFWYKVKLDTKNIYGWVYGAYVRIFFEDESLGYSDRELILESIE